MTSVNPELTDDIDEEELQNNVAYDDLSEPQHNNNSLTDDDDEELEEEYNDNYISYSKYSSSSLSSTDEVSLCDEILRYDDGDDCDDETNDDDDEIENLERVDLKFNSSQSFNDSSCQHDSNESFGTSHDTGSPDISHDNKWNETSQESKLISDASSDILYKSKSHDTSHDTRSHNTSHDSQQNDTSDDHLSTDTSHDSGLHDDTSHLSQPYEASSDSGSHDQSYVSELHDSSSENGSCDTDQESRSHDSTSLDTSTNDLSHDSSDQNASFETEGEKNVSSNPSHLDVPHDVLFDVDSMWDLIKPKNIFTGEEAIQKHKDASVNSEDVEHTEPCTENKENVYSSHHSSNMELCALSVHSGNSSGSAHQLVAMATNINNTSEPSDGSHQQSSGRQDDIPSTTSDMLYSTASDRVDCTMPQSSTVSSTCSPMSLYRKPTALSRSTPILRKSFRNQVILKRKSEIQVSADFHNQPEIKTEPCHSKRWALPNGTYKTGSNDDYNNETEQNSSHRPIPLVCPSVTNSTDNTHPDIITSQAEVNPLQAGVNSSPGEVNPSQAGVNQSPARVNSSQVQLKPSQSQIHPSPSSSYSPSHSDVFNTGDEDLSPILPPPVASQRTKFSTSDSSGGEQTLDADGRLQAKKERKRARIIEELLYTETTYQRHLDLVVKYFEMPLMENNILPMNVVTAIFSNIRQIISINKELMSHLRRLSVGEAFLRLGPFLKLYATYAKGHDRALALLMEWDQKCPDFSAFRRQQEEISEMNGLKLNALLITPVQRIPRYKLLLEELLRNTPADHKDYNAIKEAVSQVTAVASHINDNIKQQDNFMKMLAIQKSLSGPSAPKLLTPGRWFIKEGILKKVSKDGGRCYERMFYLFSDILMYAKPRMLDSGTEHSYTCCCILPLQHCQVNRVFGHSQGQGALFNVKCKDESLLLFSDQDVVNSWIKAIQETIDEFNNSRQTLRKVSSAKQPMRKAAIARILKHEKRADPVTAALRLSQIDRKRSQRALQASDSNSPSRKNAKVNHGKGSKSDPGDRQSFIESLGCLSNLSRSKRSRTCKGDTVTAREPPERVAMETDKQPSTPTVDSANSGELIEDADNMKTSTPIRSEKSDLPRPERSAQYNGSDSIQYEDVWRLEDTTLSTPVGRSHRVDSLDKSSFSQRVKISSNMQPDEGCGDVDNSSASNKRAKLGSKRLRTTITQRYTSSLSDALDAAINVNKAVCPGSPTVNYGAACILQ